MAAHERHERFEALAVGHVLGGLDDAAAAEFRSHLIGCRECRQRVAELRDLAADLAAIEREERTALRLKTQVAQDQDGGPEEDVGGRRDRSRSAGLVVLVLLLAVVVVGFWNLHLRDTNAAIFAAGERREATLEQLSTGVAVPVTTEEGVAGTVVVDEADVSFSVSQIPTLVGNEQVIVWLVGTTPADHRQVTYTPEQLVEGRLAHHLELGDAQRLVITIETPTSNGVPGGRVLLDAPLRGQDRVEGEGR